MQYTEIQRDNIMKRKEIKQKAKIVMKRHYGLLIVISLLSVLLAGELASMFSAVQTSNDTTALPSQLSANEVLKNLVEENLDAGKLKAHQIQQEEIRSHSSAVFGRTNGVIAAVVNAISSGSIYITLTAGIHTIIGSESLSVWCMVFLVMAFFFLGWCYIQNIFAIIAQRMILEARTYKYVALDRFLFLIRVHKWCHVAWVRFVEYVYRTLWAFTIIGAVIKHYSYYMIPYILAENPTLKANETIQLSKQMMYGHKWECCKLELSFLGWKLLSVMTLGFVGIFYVSPYKACTMAEYYVYVRQCILKVDPSYKNLLKDDYLYKVATPSLLQQAYPEGIRMHQKPKPLCGVRGFMANWFGILLKNGKEEREYERENHRFLRYELLKREIQGMQYPTRLFHISDIKKRSRLAVLDPLRDYSIWSLIMMFFIFSCMGWLWEVSLHLITDGSIVNRGALYGPWLPIYGFGGILILTLLKKFRTNPALTFVLILIVCGILEYNTSYVMELNTGLKWWDYTGYFLNVNGRICAEGLLLFGVGGMAFIYILAPVFDDWIQKIRPHILKIICSILLFVFVCDSVYSHFEPNEGEGITEYK